MPCASIVSAPSYAFPFHSTSSASTTCCITPSAISPTKCSLKPPPSMRKGIGRAIVSIEKETPEAQHTETFLRGVDEAQSSTSVRARFEKMIREAQDSMCSALEAADGGAKFKEDFWFRPGGGGGTSRVLQDGAVWEKAGVNISVVYGVMPPDSYVLPRVLLPIRNLVLCLSSLLESTPLVLHPNNPFDPTLHFNYCYFETDAPKDGPRAPRQWWFGGVTDLTPAYIF